MIIGAFFRHFGIYTFLLRKLAASKLSMLTLAYQFMPLLRLQLRNLYIMGRQASVKSLCLLPERALLKTVRVCGPRYWPQVMELVPEEKPWWSIGDKKAPFTLGVLYIKRKVGACSYVDDPVGCQSLLSRAKHKDFGLTSSRGSTSGLNGGSGAATIDQLASTFSSNPSLIAFAQLCCDSSWNNRSDTDFQGFCLQVLFECVSKDRPALLQLSSSRKRN